VRKSKETGSDALPKRQAQRRFDDLLMRMLGTPHQKQSVGKARKARKK
jgi:hypothetical protein